MQQKQHGIFLEVHKRVLYQQFLAHETSTTLGSIQYTVHFDTGNFLIMYIVCVSVCVCTYDT